MIFQRATNNKQLGCRMFSHCSLTSFQSGNARTLYIPMLTFHGFWRDSSAKLPELKRMWLGSGANISWEVGLKASGRYEPGERVLQHTSGVSLTMTEMQLCGWRPVWYGWIPWSHEDWPEFPGQKTGATISPLVWPAMLSVAVPQFAVREEGQAKMTGQSFTVTGMSIPANAGKGAWQKQIWTAYAKT